MIQRQEPTPGQPLSNIVGVLSRPHASANIEYDSRDTIERYIPNASAIEAIDSFFTGLDLGAMLSITGSYGSGKSSFGVMLNHLVAPSSSDGWKAAHKRMHDMAPDTAAELVKSRKEAGVHQNGMIRCLATARLEPVAATILRAADSGAKSCFGSRYGRKDFAEAGMLRNCMKSLRKGMVPDASTVAGVIASMASSTPVLLMIDEFGKNIEYFAAGGRDGDLFLLQELAEMSGIMRRIPLHVVTMQHMAFGEYAAGASAGRMREWTKIQGRFADVRFSNSLEHTRAILAAALRPANGTTPSVMDWAKKHVKTTANETGVNITAEIAASCYPLHPLAVEALPELCSRYGQNNRTLQSFISGGGPGTISRFVGKERCGNDGSLPTMGIDTLYDYFVSGSTAARQGGAEASRLVEIDTIIRDAHGLADDEQMVLKAIGLMNLVGQSGRLRASMGMIRCVAGQGAGQAVSRLERRSLITYRRHADEYRVWHGTDVNIAAKLDVWRKAGRNMSFSALMRASTNLEPVVAARHGIRTGTMRIFACLFEGSEIDTGVGYDSVDEYDGAILYGTKDTAIPVDARPVLVSRCNDVSALREAASEVMALRSVWQDGDIRNDWVARREVSESLAAAENGLDAAFDRAYGKDTTWVYMAAGKEHGITGTAGHAASIASDAVYPDSPPIRNETINRNHLTAQGSMALNRMLSAIIEGGDREVLGLEGWKPERAIYEVLMRKYRIHGEKDGAYRLSRPRGNELSKVWNAALARMRNSKRAVPLAAIYDIWRRPPYGMKTGPMPILALLIIMHMRGNIAVYEHGSYVPRVNASMAERLVKNPQHFTLKYFHKTASRRELIRQTAKRIGADPDHGVLGIVGHVVGMVRMLPVYTARTRKLDKRTLAVRNAIQNAVEPDTLLLESLPAALGLGRFGKTIQDADIAAFAGGLERAVGDLQTAFDRMMGEKKKRLLAETGTANRESLAKAASALLPDVSDQGMKVFLGAVSAEIPDEKAWMIYVALTLTDTPPAEWSDEQGEMFGNRLREVSAGFKRLAALKFAAVAGSLDGPSVMVVIIRPDGQEKIIILPADDERIAGFYD